jgi:hypothetical protein
VVSTGGPHFFFELFFLPPCVAAVACLEDPAPALLAAASCAAAAATALGRPLTLPGCRGTSSATLSNSARPVGSNRTGTGVQHEGR